MVANYFAIPKYAGQRDECARYPDDEYHEQNAFECSLLSILDAVLDGPVAVERYAAQMKHGGRAQQNVRRNKEMAEESTEQPLAVNNVQYDVEGHDDAGDERVGDGQANYEYVLHALQRFVGEHGQYDQDVAQDA